MVAPPAAKVSVTFLNEATRQARLIVVDHHRLPSGWVSENEWRQVYELQHGEVKGQRDAGRPVQDVAQCLETDGETER